MNRYFLFFLAVAFFTRVVIFLFCVTSPVGLMPDEAHYWTWSQHLDIGYYSKPPAIAWQIALGTLLFGSTELGVRFIAMLMPLVTSLGVYGIVYELTAEKQASWLAAAAFLLSPLGTTASLLATTDSGFVLCWVMALFVYVKFELKQAQDDSYRFLYIGGIIAFGALWKWAMYTLWIPLILFELRYTRNYAKLFFGILVSCLGLLPSLVWNISHNFVTFRHVSATLIGSHTTMSHGNFWAFFLASVALISPGFFVLGLWAYFQKAGLRERFLQLVVAIIWGGVLFASCFRKMQGNWAVAGQVLIFVFIGLFLAKNKEKKLFFWFSCILSIVLQTAVLAAPYMGWVTWSPFKQGMDNRNIARDLLDAGYDPHKDYLVSDRYQTVSELWFYGPQQKEVYFLNIHGLRQNQFCFWQGLQEVIGEHKERGFFATIVPQEDESMVRHQMKRLKKKLSLFYRKVSSPKIYWLSSREDNFSQGMIIFSVDDFYRKELTEVNKF